VKIMKDEGRYRTETNATALCVNEVFVYKKIIPYFQKYLKKLNIKSFDPDKWSPRIYYADYKIYEELADTEETVLVMENLTRSKFRLGPRLDLNESHLVLLMKHIATYHAVSYALKITEDPMYKELVGGLIPYSFLAPDGSDIAFWHAFFQRPMKRTFSCVFNDASHRSNRKFIEDVKKFQESSLERPLVLMESFLKFDENYSIILHGDYNRNNVLFKYE
jgi:Ecdysteroid kinase-like family